jgi:hypothetical protein
MYHNFISFRLTVISAGKKWTQEKLAARLTEAADIVKAVYRFMICTSSIRYLLMH